MVLNPALLVFPYFFPVFFLYLFAVTSKVVYCTLSHSHIQWEQYLYL